LHVVQNKPFSFFPRPYDSSRFTRLPPPPESKGDYPGTATLFSFFSFQGGYRELFVRRISSLFHLCSQVGERFRSEWLFSSLLFASLFTASAFLQRRIRLLFCSPYRKKSLPACARRNRLSLPPSFVDCGIVMVLIFFFFPRPIATPYAQDTSGVVSFPPPSPSSKVEGLSFFFFPLLWYSLSIIPFIAGKHLFFPLFFMEPTVSVGIPPPPSKDGNLKQGVKAPLSTFLRAEGSPDTL